MNKAIALLRKIHIHPLLWVIIALAVATAHFIELMMVLLIIFVHEMGHGAAASFFFVENQENRPASIWRGS
ncbi:hypothetical protein [Mesobacillus jeotgali]|uniref:hypothetical protein n=1 Tax=Mesobacillus jeotgali TaxID=129985 RepID=UPI0029CAAFC3|nr:hypothetical protein [Mesobacillus jeotgali]